MFKINTKIFKIVFIFLTGSKATTSESDGDNMHGGVLLFILLYLKSSESYFYFKDNFSRNEQMKNLNNFSKY